MKRKNLILGVGALALFLAMNVKKYKGFLNKLSFKVVKGRIKAKFPFNTIDIIIKVEAFNPTETTINLFGATGTLSMQGKKIANIRTTSGEIRQGKNYFDVIATTTPDELENIFSLKFDTSKWQNLVRQIVNEPVVSDITYRTNLGNFSSKDTWRISES